MATQTISLSTAAHDASVGYNELSTAEKNTIPIVRHVITESEAAGSAMWPLIDISREYLIYGEQSPYSQSAIDKVVKAEPVSLPKVVKLLTDSHSSMLLERHLHALRSLIKSHSKGFLMKDLVSVLGLLNVCADRIAEQQAYIEPMCQIINLCSKPLLKQKTSDETAYEQIAVESLAQLAYLMRVPCREIRLQLCETLVQFFCAAHPKQRDVDERLQAATLQYNRKIIEKSDVSETLVKALTLLEDDVKVKVAVLDVLQRFSVESVHNCEMMLNVQAAYRICSRLMDADASGKTLFLSVDILWNLLENASRHELAKQLNNRTCVSQIQEGFIHQLTQGFSHYDRQLRNDLLIIASLVADSCKDPPFLETGFTKQLVLFSTFQEVKSHHALVRYLKLLQNHEDFELKKLLINIIIILAKDTATIPTLSDGKILLALFSYVKANEKTTSSKDWTVAQFEELQLHAMSALCTLAPLLLEDYMTCQGGTRLLLLLEWCVSADNFGGHGNSFHGAGGRNNKRAQMHHCLRLMRSMVSTNKENVLQDFVDQGAINQLNSILLGGHTSEQTNLDDIDVALQCDMLFILSVLCEGDSHRKEIFGNSGVEILTHLLKKDASCFSGGLLYQQVMLAAVDCIWCAIVGCFITEDYFLETDGLFLLVDLLESNVHSLHNLVLGCLVDLSENPKTISHLNAWRGKNNKSAAHLFCEIWRQEEQELGVKRENHGSIADIKQPLTTTLQLEQGVIPLAASCLSPAIVDVSENMRAKLYALFCKMGFIELPGLTTEDHVTLTIIERYLDFKLGEVWSEIQQELSEEKIEPITPDQEALEAICRTIEDRATHVLDIQRELLDAQNQQDLLDEQEYYAQIRENHRQKEKAINDFYDFVARTSNYTLLKAAKERQELSIDASRVQNNYKAMDTFHTTDIPNLQTTAFSGRHITIQQNPDDVS